MQLKRGFVPRALSMFIFLMMISFGSGGHAWGTTYTLLPVNSPEKSTGEYLHHAVVTVMEEKENGESGVPMTNLSAPFSPNIIKDYLDIFSNILVFGEKVWKLVRDNAAVLKVENRAISVLPNVLDQKVTPMDLEQWQWPKNKVFHFVGYSNFGNVLADMVYTLHFSYGGQYEGKGQYLTGVDITPSKVYVKWGNKLEVKSDLKSVVNLGAKDNPLVAATLEVAFRLDTPFSSRLMTDLITVAGDGQIVLGQENISLEKGAGPWE